MKHFGIYITILLLLSLCSGCVTAGILYTHVTRPLDTNMSETLNGIAQANGSIKLIHLPVAVPLDFLWDSTAVGDIAKEHGLETVHFADLERLSVLTVWNRYTLHLYGE